MSLEDCQFLDGFKGKRVKLTLKSAAFVGVVQRITLNKAVVLESVVDANSGRQFPGTKLFFGREILNVEFPCTTDEDTGDTNSVTNDLCPEGQLTVAEFQPYRKSIVLDHEDVEQYINYIVIDEFHEKFMPAVMHIRKQKVIGIGADGFGALQHERLCWLQIATKNKVYLFDILLLGARAFKNGLSVILETSSILKVTHNCRIISGGLMAQFGVKLTNVFDTQVADFMYFNMETGGLLPDRVSTLQEVVSLHLKMPTSHLTSLDIKSQLAKEDSQVWCIRPCSTSLLKVMALSVMHLQSLRLVLLDALMSDYTSLVDSCLCSHRNEIVQTQDIGQDSELELPRELRQIQQLRKDRQAWAQEVYPQTEGGLLLRFKPPLTPAAADVATPCGNSTPVIPTDFSAVPSKSPRKTTSAESVVSSQTDSGLEILMNTMGRGRFPVGDCIPRGPAPFPGMGRGLALPEKVPSVGRGFHHQIPQLASPLSLSFRKGE